MFDLGELWSEVR